MDLSQYRDSLGKPNEGVHSSRIGPFASFDLIGTIIIGCIIGYYLISPDAIGCLYGFIILMLLAICLHRIFRVNTSLNIMIFGYLD